MAATATGPVRGRIYEMAIHKRWKTGSSLLQCCRHIGVYRKAKWCLNEAYRISNAKMPTIERSYQSQTCSSLKRSKQSTRSNTKPAPFALDTWMARMNFMHVLITFVGIWRACRRSRLPVFDWMFSFFVGTTKLVFCQIRKSSAVCWANQYQRMNKRRIRYVYCLCFYWRPYRSATMSQAKIAGDHLRTQSKRIPNAYRQAIKRTPQTQRHTMDIVAGEHHQIFCL